MEEQYRIKEEILANGNKRYCIQRSRQQKIAKFFGLKHELNIFWDILSFRNYDSDSWPLDNTHLEDVWVEFDFYNKNDNKRYQKDEIIVFWPPRDAKIPHETYPRVTKLAIKEDDCVIETFDIQFRNISSYIEYFKTIEAAQLTLKCYLEWRDKILNEHNRIKTSLFNEKYTDVTINNTNYYEVNIRKIEEND